jgi:hypothetical protein
MRSPINISIPEPCGESWQKMTPVPGGRHCDVCEKCIVDFTQSSDKEIWKAYKKKGEICGQFRSDQLNRLITGPREKRLPMGIAAAAALSMSTPAMAQTSAPAVVEIPSTYQQQVNTYPQEVILKGRVYDNETGEPIPFANVQLWSNGEMVYRGNTDFDGYFGVPESIVAANPVDAIVVSSMGYTDIRKSFDPPLTPRTFEQLTVELKNVLGRVDIITGTLGKVVIIKAPWYKRLWWRIKRPFH